ncbi:MAG: hypothetical protein CMB56_001220 [Methanobacteriota archaeon]|nr:MAG: hypothetical protein CMB56_001220 [Euryarchaeota archaeon]|tara:strand:- start:1673 stop:2413 length:741 start_codon:yes stop_codon:yes gene_type:complete
MRVIRLPGIHHDSNSILICDSKEVAVIDCGTSWYQLLIEERIRGQLNSDSNICKIFLTSRRFNHCGASSFLSSVFDAEILIHESAVNSLSGGDHFSTWASRFNSDMPHTIASPIADEQKFKIGNLFLEAIHLPGHSIDSMGYYLESHELLVAGSTIPGENMISRWDLPTGCLPDLADSIEGLIDLDLEILITGFGEQINGKKSIVTLLESHRDFLDKCIDIGDSDFSELYVKPSKTVTYLTPKIIN